MKYDEQFPPIRQLLSLAENTQFPATRKEIQVSAAIWGFTNAVIDFLSLFPADEVFESKVDFVTRSELLEMFINQEHEMPKEFLRSSQG